MFIQMWQILFEVYSMVGMREHVFFSLEVALLPVMMNSGEVVSDISSSKTAMIGLKSKSYLLMER